MGEFLIWVSGFTGLVTLGTFVRQLLLRYRTGDKTTQKAANWATVWKLRIDLSQVMPPTYRRWRWKHLDYDYSYDDITYVLAVRSSKLPLLRTFIFLGHYLPAEIQEYTEEHYTIMERILNARGRKLQRLRDRRSRVPRKPSS